MQPFPTRRSSDLSEISISLHLINRPVQGHVNLISEMVLQNQVCKIHKFVPAFLDYLFYLQPARQVYWIDEVNSQHVRSEEHTSELQSRGHLVCRLLLEKKKTTKPECEYIRL